MIRQDGNGNQNNGRSTQRNSSRIPIVSDVLDMFGGGGQPEMQTTTQQTLPAWALDYVQNTLDMTKYYTNNQNYRPSTLDRDYSGIRGYNGQGQPNSQVGQFGLNPMPAQPVPPLGPLNPDNLIPKLPLMRAPEPGAGITGNLFGGGMGVSGRALQNMGPNSFQPRTGLIENPNSPGFVDDRKNRTSRGMGRSTGYSYSDGYGSGDYTYSDQGTDNYYGSDTYDGSFTDPSSYSGGYDESDSGYDITSPPSPPAIDGGLEFSSEDSWVWGSGNSGNSTDNTSSNDSSNNQTTLPAGMSQEEVQALIDEQLQQFDANTITPDEMPTPFQAYDRQRFAAPSDRTVQGETLLANRVYGGNPFAEAQAAARGASNYRSQFSPAALNLTGPTANTYNNVNQGLLAEEYGNANAGLTPAQNYSRDFQQNLAQFQDPYTSQVVDQTIQDLDRARRITNNDISGNAARAGAFGGSREALMRTENNRNFADRTAAAVGQLRSQGFQQAAERAQQEQLQRLGLTASDIQNLRGYQSAGNLQGQNISAQDVRDVRGLQSQGALTAQGLGAQSDRDAMGFQNQLQMQGNQLGVEQARLAEQFRQGAGALNLQGAGALGNLAQMQTADERQRIADLLASGGAQDARNQQDLDFIFNEFNRELAYPGQQIDLRNAAISPATGSIVTTTQPRYSSGGLPQAAGVGLATYGALAGIPAAAPYALPAALAMGLLNY